MSYIYIMQLIYYLSLIPFVIYAIRHYVIGSLAIIYHIRKKRANNHSFYDVGNITISVIIPCHNEESVIGDTIRHLINQDLPPYVKGYEIIVVDDASTDRTPDILKKYSELWPTMIKVIRKEKAEGKAKALNYGIKHSNGDIIVIIDADHFLERSTIHKLTDMIVKGKAEIVQGACVIRNETDNILTRLIATDYYGGYYADLPGRTFLRSCPIAGSNVAIKRSVFEKIGLFDEGILAEDTEFTIRAILNGYEVKYIVDAKSSEEAVTSIRSYINQRRRWVNGHMNVLKKYLIKTILSKNLKIYEKIELLLFEFIYTVPIVGFFSIIFWLVIYLTHINLGTNVIFSSIQFGLFMLLALFYELFVGLLFAGKLRNLIYLPLYIIKSYLDIIVVLIGTIDFIMGRKKWIKTERRKSRP